MHFGCLVVIGHAFCLRQYVHFYRIGQSKSSTIKFIRLKSNVLCTHYEELNAVYLNITYNRKIMTTKKKDQNNITQVHKIVLTKRKL